MRFWAHATSPAPIGLGLAPERLWALSWREYDALQEQFETYHRNQLQLWAAERAQFANVWTPRKDGAPWHPADFLPDTPETRNQKMQYAAERAQRAREQAEVAMLNARLMRMQPGGSEEGIPEWARMNEKERAQRGR